MPILSQQIKPLADQLAGQNPAPFLKHLLSLYCNSFYSGDFRLSASGGQGGFPAKFVVLSENLKMPCVYGLEVNHKLKKVAL